MVQLHEDRESMGNTPSSSQILGILVAVSICFFRKKSPQAASHSIPQKKMCDIGSSRQVGMYHSLIPGFSLSRTVQPLASQRRALARDSDEILGAPLPRGSWWWGLLEGVHVESS